MFVSCTSTEKKKDMKSSENVEKNSHAFNSSAKSGLNEKTLGELAKKNIDLKFRVISSGSAQRIFPATVIRNQADLLSFYKSYFNRCKNLPVIDFEKEAVVAISGGSCNTGGYSVDLLNAKTKEKNIYLEFILKAPGVNDIVTQAFTKPYTIISIETNPEQKITIEFKGSDIKSSKIR